MTTLATLDRFGLVTWEGEAAMLRMTQVTQRQRVMEFNDGCVLPFGSRRDRIRLFWETASAPPGIEAIVRSLTRICRSSFNEVGLMIFRAQEA